MALKRTDFTKYLMKKGYEIFWDSYEETDDVWPMLFEEEDTEDPYVEGVSMAGLDDLVEKGEDEPIKYDKIADGWPYIGRVRTFARGIAFSMELYDDTQVEKLFEKAVSQWSKAYQRTRDRYYARFFNEGAYTAGSDIFDNTVPGVKIDPTGKFVYDGKPFFADSSNPHPLKHSDKKIVNYAGLPLTYDNLKTVYTRMTVDNAFDEKGNEIVIQPSVLLVPSALELEARALVESDYLPNTSGTPSIKNPFKGKLQVVTWRRLETPDGWFLVEPKRGITALNRMDITIDSWEDPETKQIKASVICRFGGYVHDIRYAFGCNLPQTP